MKRSFLWGKKRNEHAQKREWVGKYQYFDITISEITKRKRTSVSLTLEVKKDTLHGGLGGPEYPLEKKKGTTSVKKKID